MYLYPKYQGCICWSLGCCKVTIILDYGFFIQMLLQIQQANPQLSLLHGYHTILDIYLILSKKDVGRVERAGKAIICNTNSIGMF